MTLVAPISDNIYFLKVLQSKNLFRRDDGSAQKLRGQAHSKKLDQKFIRGSNNLRLDLSPDHVGYIGAPLEPF